MRPTAGKFSLSKLQKSAELAPKLRANHNGLLLSLARCIPARLPASSCSSSSSSSSARPCLRPELVSGGPEEPKTIELTHHRPTARLASTGGQLALPASFWPAQFTLRQQKHFATLAENKTRRNSSQSKSNNLHQPATSCCSCCSCCLSLSLSLSCFLPRSSKILLNIESSRLLRCLGKTARQSSKPERRKQNQHSPIRCVCWRPNCSIGSSSSAFEVNNSTEFGLGVSLSVERSV